MNQLRTFVLLAGLTGLFLAIGYMLAGEGGIVIAFAIALGMILAPLAAMVVQMAISRTREYRADRIGAEICGHPLWLASALAKIEDAAGHIENAEAEHNPATAHMFIINPLHGGGMARLFSSHPATAERVRRLREIAGATGPWG